MWCNAWEDGFSLGLGQTTLLEHTLEAPMLYLGVGQETVEAYRGNFSISDEVVERIPFSSFEVRENTPRRVTVLFWKDDRKVSYSLTGEWDGSTLHFTGQCGSRRYNRLFLRLPAQEQEEVFGGGEQFSFFNLRGKSFPIWTREQGVGRNKKTELTFRADCLDGGGGDYHTTYYPEPTFVSSRNYFFHLRNYDYSLLNFTHQGFHEIEVWNTEISADMACGENYLQLLDPLTKLLGRQAPLPEWAMKGIWLGMQGGTELCVQKLEKMLEQKVDVTGVWIQDWVGKRITSFGKRVQWDWCWNPEMYPELPRVIARWKEKGVRFLGYINPYLVQDGALFAQASKQGLLVKNAQGGDYLMDCGEFDSGIVDLTNPVAFEWYKDVIKENLIGLGFGGWMADFGEYLPTDCVLHSGESPLSAHNQWPALWARVNYEAVAETGNLGEVIFFTRSGAAGTQTYSTMMWAGDQCVDFSLDDGLGTVITAALSLAMTGYGIHGSDIGGYTGLFGMKRTKEVLLRWLDFCTFTPVMRTHEGNRPDENHQFDSDEETIRHFARMSRLHTALLPYMKELSRENSRDGLPMMRPLMLHYQDDPKTSARKYEYLLGRDLLVAPVYLQDATERELYLPEDEWVNLWDGSTHLGGMVTVPAPLGKPPVFYRKNSSFAPLFAALRG